MRLPTEGLHHDDCVEDLGEERRHPAVALALEPDGLPQLVREAEGGERHQREHREAGRRQLPVHDEHHPEHAEDDEHLAQDDEHAVDQHLAQHVRVARRPQHEVAGAMSVVDGEREPLQVREVAPADRERETLAGGGDQVALVVGEETADECDHEEEHARHGRDAHGAVALREVEGQRPAQVVFRDEGVVEDDLDRPGAGERGEDRPERAHQGEDQLPADPVDVGLEVVEEPDEAFPADVLKERVLLQGHSGPLGSVGGVSRSSRGHGRRSGPRCTS